MDDFLLSSFPDGTSGEFLSLSGLSFSPSLKHQCCPPHGIFLKVLRERKSLWPTSVVSDLLFCLPALCRERDCLVDVCILAAWSGAPTLLSAFFKGSFRFRTKRRGRYRDFPGTFCLPGPFCCQCLHQRGPLLQSHEPVRAVHPGTPKP